MALHLRFPRITPRLTIRGQTRRYVSAPIPLDPRPENPNLWYPNLKRSPNLPQHIKTAGVAKLRTRGLISVSGEDVRKFLNGAVTAEIPLSGALPPAQYAAFLSAVGRVLFDVIIYPDSLGISGSSPEDSVLVECDSTQVENLTAHLKKYKLRAKVNVRALEEGEAMVFAAWGGHQELLEKVPGFYTQGAFGVVDPRLASFGARVVAKGVDTSPYEVLELPHARPDEYFIHRIINGIAEGQAEIIHGSALPLESNFDMLNGISFHKGCYVGQELTIRTKHRGVVRKRILPFVTYEPTEEIPMYLDYKPIDKVGDVPEKEQIIRSTKRRGAPLGRFLKGIGNIGLALCRLEPLTGMRVPGEDPDLPFSYNHFGHYEFRYSVPGMVPKRMTGPKVDGIKKPDYTIMVEGEVDRKLHVKAFVPEWMAEVNKAGLEKERIEREKKLEEVRLRAEAERQAKKRFVYKERRDGEDVFDEEEEVEAEDEEIEEQKR